MYENVFVTQNAHNDHMNQNFVKCDEGGGVKKSNVTSHNKYEFGMLLSKVT